MRKFYFLMLAAILTISGAMALVSCSDDDVNNSIVTDKDLRQTALGLHLDLSDVLLGGNSVRVWDLKDDDTFIAYDLYLDEEYEFTVDSLSGRWKTFVNSDLEWDIDDTIQVHGISVVYDWASGIPGDESGTQRFFGFNECDDETGEIDDNSLFFISEKTILTLASLESLNEHPEAYSDEDTYINNEDEIEENASTYLAQTRAAGVGTGPNEQVQTGGEIAGDVELKRSTINTKQDQKELYDKVMSAASKATKGTDYSNPNDKSFTRENWRKQQSIYLYDAMGDDLNVGGKKFTKVQLPWSTEATNNNLPMNFCDNIAPEYGWELVMNYCGNTISKDYNFFALYNKYMGILRFFTYIPSNYNANGANDHAWEVTLNEMTAQHLGLRYGLPMDKQIVNRGAIGMNGTDYSVLCSPWIAAKSRDNYATPNVGWWAFDVDLSSYRPGFSDAFQRLRLQMRAWEKSQVSLSSTIKANIQDIVPGNAYNINSLKGWVSMVKEVGTNAYKLGSSISKGEYGEAIQAGFTLFGNGYNVISSFPDPDKKDRFEIVKNIEGTINTKGLVEGSKSVSNVASPDFPLSRFETKNSTLGQGVWNIKSSPVVYQLDAQFAYEVEDAGGQAVRPKFPLLNEDASSYKATACLYDPSSVEVVLNPNVFPKKQIEYVDVQSFCGVRKGTKHDSGNDYRVAYGLTINNEYSISKGASWFKSNSIQNDNPVWDYFSDNNEKMDLKYPTIYKDCETDDAVHYALIGRGDDNCLFEPVMFGYDKSFWGNGSIKPYMPSYEVTVIVCVKLKNISTPFCYTRTFLPEVKWVGFKDANAIVKHATEWVEQLKKSKLTSKKVGTTFQEWQVKHMKDVFSYLRPGYEMISDKYTFTSISDGGDYVSKLFDGNLKTDWQPSIKARVNGSDWEASFKASRPINIKSYTLYNSSVWDEYESEPTLWDLQGKNARGTWDQIDVRHNEQPRGNSASKTYVCKNPGTYQEFRLTVVNYNGSLSSFKVWMGWNLRLRIAELVINE